MEKKSLPKVAIVGRPNVGKSSLFNRILGARKAIVEPMAGTTRDRICANVRWKGRAFTLIDMAGFEDERRGDISELVLKQIRQGIKEADVILFLTDGAAGVVPQDKDLSSILRKSSKRIFLVVNKIDRDADSARALDFYELGLGEPYAVSAMHGRGVDELCNDLVKGIEGAPEEKAGNAIRVAIIGRPNVGKSSYLNALLNEERVIVHHIAGTTTDAVDTDFSYNGREFVLVDTAGIRHNPKLKRPADFYGGVRANEAIRRSDIAILLIDGYEGPRRDDAHILETCTDEGKPVIVAVNKWDLVKKIEMSKFQNMLTRDLGGIRDTPIVFISAKTGRNVHESLEMIRLVYEKSCAIIPPDRLAETLKTLNNVPQISGKRIKFKCLVQERSSPPSFVVGMDSSAPLDKLLKRSVDNFIRKEYNLQGVPIRIRYR